MSLIKELHDNSPPSTSLIKDKQAAILFASTRTLDHNAELSKHCPS